MHGCTERDRSLLESTGNQWKHKGNEIQSTVLGKVCKQGYP